ncbi:exocyst complex component EXO70A1-like [Wolffia australiana]
MENCMHIQGDGMGLAQDIVQSMSSLSIDLLDGATAERISYDDVIEWLDGVQEKIMNLDSEKAFALDAELEEAEEFVRTIDEVRELTESLERAVKKNTSSRGRQIRDRARSLLQSAMEKFEDEFIRILIRSQQSPDIGRLSFQSFEDSHGDGDEGSLNNSFGDNSFNHRFNADGSISLNHALFDPVDPAAVPDLKSIAELMFRSGYSGECIQVYISTRKGVLEESLASLRVAKSRTEELMAMDSKALDPKIKRWIQAMKVFCQIYLPGEKKLCDDIFGPSESATCFCNTTKGSLFQLLSFGMAIAISRPEYDKIFGLLNMLECLAELMPSVEDLFSSKEEEDSVIDECLELQAKLGDSAIASFFKFKDAVLGYSSSTPYPGGGPFHLTKYVMNYIAALAEYDETLGKLLQHHEGDQEGSALRRSLLAMVNVLEDKIRVKSNLYTDEALRHFFVMNNVHYMAKKAMASNLRELLGDDWIRARNVQVRQQALMYQRISWSPILEFFKEEGIFSHGSSHSPSRSVLKERFKSFNHAFEEIYKIQTGWLIRDERLRDDVVISISMNVLQAYMIFKGRHEAHLDGVRRREKYIKFSVDDLQRLVLDLFLGSPKSLPPPRRGPA